MLRQETVLAVHHWTDRLFSFVTTRDPAFRFENGQFTMVGQEVAGKPLLRAYSLASANHEEQLEFFSIKVPDGPLTSRLQHLKPGDPILVSGRAVGTLIPDNLLPGERLYLLATGTGLAPFLALIKDPAVYERFSQVVLVHGARFVADLAYGGQIALDLPRHPLLGELVRDGLHYVPAVTREPFRTQGRITQLIESNRLTDHLGLPPLNAATDRVMLCGSQRMLDDLTLLLEARGFQEGNSSSPGHYIIEKAFVEK